MDVGVKYPNCHNTDADLHSARSQFDVAHLKALHKGVPGNSGTKYYAEAYLRKMDYATCNLKQWHMYEMYTQCCRMIELHKKKKQKNKKNTKQNVALCELEN